MKLTCEQVARAVLGEPAKRQGRELLWLCPCHDDRHPSLCVNAGKNCWLCGPCGKSGNAWELAAFFAGVGPDDKRAVTAWLRERGLLNAGKVKSPGGGRGPDIPSDAAAPQHLTPRRPGSAPWLGARFRLAGAGRQSHVASAAKRAPLGGHLPGDGRRAGHSRCAGSLRRAAHSRPR